MSFTPSFPEPGKYVRYWDQTAKEFKFLRLMERSGSRTSTRSESTSAR